MHAELCRVHGSGAVCSIPLFADGDSAGPREREAVGALTLERQEPQAFDESSVDLCETTTGLAAPLLHMRYRDERSLVAKAGESSTKLIRGSGVAS